MRQPKPKKTEQVEEVAVETVEVEEVAAEVPAAPAEPFNRLLVFTSPVCGPCKNLKPVLEKLSANYSFTPEYISYDADATAGIFLKFGVRNVPALVHVKTSHAGDPGAELQEEVLDRRVGYEGEAKLIQLLTQWGYIK